MSDFIEAGDEIGDWSLLVDRGDVVAVRTVPYEGQVIYSTEDRPNRADRTSEHQLDAREVVRRFVDEGDTDRAFGDLIDDVQVALGEVEANA